MSVTAEAPTRLPLAATGEEHHRTKGLLRLTMACNERCPFCNVPVEDYARPTPPEAELYAAVDEFVASGERTLTVSGGEPTLYRDRLVEVVKRARAGGVPFVELQTNAVLIDPGYATELAEAGLTSAFVSLLSDQAELHDRLAGLEGAFPRCLAGIDALLAQGVAVTLNPVIAKITERRVASYIDFVAERLPGVRAISLSAVQPHGRARHDLDLMPDYSVLAEEVPRAQARAAEHGILLVNPYCGLPACVGWADSAERSVEAIEARAAREMSSRHRARGLDNSGNKSHGPPCRDCALRPRCGGAWHEYWQHRGGSGLSAPLRRIAPWLSGADSEGQTVVSAPDGLSAEHFDAMRQSKRPTVWAMTNRLRAGDAERLFSAGATDLALLGSVAELAEDRQTMAELDRMRSKLEIRTVVGLTRLGSFAAAHDLLRSLSRQGVEAVHLLMRTDERYQRFAAIEQKELGLELVLPE